MSLRYFPGNIALGDFVVKGALRTDASSYITGPVEAATGLIGDGSAHFAKNVYHATGMDVCGPLVCATAITSCGSTL